MQLGDMHKTYKNGAGGWQECALCKDVDPTRLLCTLPHSLWASFACLLRRPLWLQSKISGTYGGQSERTCCILIIGVLLGRDFGVLALLVSPPFGRSTPRIGAARSNSNQQFMSADV
jgi:hypothetical protein